MMKKCLLFVLVLTAAFLGGCMLEDRHYNPKDVKLNPGAGRADANGIVYYDARVLGIQGRGWQEKDLECCYDRLPAKAKDVVRGPVWKLSQDSAGMYVDFVTDSNAIYVKYILRKSDVAMYHMPATGVSGVDMYTLTDGRWQALATVKDIRYPQTNAVLINRLDPGNRTYRAYLPLYNGVSSFEIGIRAGASISKTDRAGGRKPIVFYGTSITQGGCASRPGMCHTNILGRRLGWPIVNLGFSGNGKMEPEMAELVSEIDAQVYVLDALPNLDPTAASERIKPFVIKLRQAHPETPILFAEFMCYPNQDYVKGCKDRTVGNNKALSEAIESLKRKGYKKLYLVTREELLDKDGEGMVDGVHPTDLGFFKMADGFETSLKKILNRRF